MTSGRVKSNSFEGGGGVCVSAEDAGGFVGGAATEVIGAVCVPVVWDAGGSGDGAAACLDRLFRFFLAGCGGVGVVSGGREERMRMASVSVSGGTSSESLSVVAVGAVFLSAGGGESTSTEAASSTSMSAVLTSLAGWYCCGAVLEAVAAAVNEGWGWRGALAAGLRAGGMRRRLRRSGQPHHQAWWPWEQLGQRAGRHPPDRSTARHASVSWEPEQTPHRGARRQCRLTCP